MPDSRSNTRSTIWPDLHTVWRWHVLAGLFCLPFVVFLCLTGTAYLFRPQVDDWIDRRYDHLAAAGPAATAQAQVRAALAAVPDSRLLAYELPRGPGSAVRVIVDRGGEAIRVYVHPSLLAILKQVREEDRFERIVLKLHGQLLLGNAGSMIMEMVASWTIVLIVTGLYLWWPRPASRAPASDAPPSQARASDAVASHALVSHAPVSHALALHAPASDAPASDTPASRILASRTPGAADGDRGWRSLHALTGAWVSLFLVLFLVSGLPWSFVWGHALARVQGSVSRLSGVQGWEIGAQPMRNVVAGPPVASAVPAAGRGAASMPGMDMDAAPPADADALGGLDAVVAAGRRLDFPAPVLVTPPVNGSDVWRVRSDTQNRPRRIDARVAASGTVLGVDRFAQKGPVDRIVGYGVAAHEGRLFGWANVLLNLVVAVGLLAMSVAAIVLWLRRRPPGGLGVPRALPDRRVGPGAVAAMLVLGVLLPELGASLLLLWLASLGLRRRRNRGAVPG